MASRKTGSKSKSRKPSGKSRKPRAVATRKTETAPAFAYADRVPIIADEIRHAGRALTVAEIFESVESDQFRTPRRVAASIRADARSESPVLEHATTTTIRLRKRTRAATGGKKSGGKVSRRKTRAAS